MRVCSKDITVVFGMPGPLLEVAGLDVECGDGAVSAGLFPEVAGRRRDDRQGSPRHRWWRRCCRMGLYPLWNFLPS